MNTMSRAIICALLLGGTTQPIDWKYIFPWTVVAAACFGGGFYLTQQIQRLEKENKEKEGQIKGLQKRLNLPEGKSDINGSKKASRSKNVKSSPGSEALRNPPAEAETKEEIIKLRTELNAKEQIIKDKDKTIREQSELIENYWPLIDAIDLDSTSTPLYVLKLHKLDPKVLLSFRIDKEDFEIIKESKLCAPYRLIVHPVVSAWINATNEKDMTMKKKGLKHNEEQLDNLMAEFNKKAEAEALKVPPPPLTIMPSAVPEMEQVKNKSNEELKRRYRLSLNSAHAVLEGLKSYE